ncbi:hypothetical protein OEM_p200030 (plasmid) [Mycobacterium intracellulare subsp. yongonense 05-1390]|uniref:hypothetical protein n=1 Tax=Mycobacterium TaxID=1763 RepID=UPI0002B61B28|nr:MULTISPECIES: hypothetical protein [Mycobacterium]AFV14926.1 hypothetical protein OEM_p200030 [Mycobacterium intracellulare subsp. yongonense 05-1390]
MDVLDALTTQAHTLLTCDNRSTSRSPSVQLARSVHATPPAIPADVRSHLRGAPHVLPALARHAQAGDRYALLIAAVFLRDLLRTIALRAAGLRGDDIAERTDDALALVFTLLRSAAEPDTLTEPLIAAQLSKQLQRRHSGPDAAVLVDPHAPVLDRPSSDLDQDRDAARQLLADARDHHVITALEYQTLAVLYLQRPGTLHATHSAVERRAQRAIRKLATRYRPHHPVAA